MIRSLNTHTIKMLYQVGAVAVRDLPIVGAFSYIIWSTLHS